nr:MAG TPA: Major capsid protein [Microviridae sp.]
MSHFTGLKELQNKPHKSGHDISAKNCFTAKVGELLPVWTDFAIPNSTYRFNLEYFTRTRPVQTSAYTRIREYFDFFAVPCNLIWKSFDSAVIQMGEKAPIQSKDLLTSLTVKGDLPYCTINDFSQALYFSGGNTATGSFPHAAPGFENIFGYNRGDVNHKLLSMLDYGNVVSPSGSGVGTTSNRWWNGSSAPSGDDLKTYSQKYNVNLAVNLFSLATYQKIYQDFFRWSQWENADPTSYNFDWYTGSGNLFGSSGLDVAIPPSNNYWKRDNLFSLRYANWNKDKFMGILPNSQFGDLAVVDLGTISTSGSKIPVGAYDGINDTGDFHQMQTRTESVNAATSSASKSTPLYPRFPDSISIRENSNLWAVLGQSSDLNLKFSVLALRQAEALQKWKEITQSVDTNYRDQIKAHFGVNVPQSESHMAKYIGGIARNLDISEVVNQFLPSEETFNTASQAYIYGKGVGSGQGSMTFSTGSGYYMLMCIYHAVPLLDYALSGPDGQNLVTSVEDLPIPEFDNIGMESVPAVELMNSNLYSNVNSADKILGYNPRYYNWKTKIDRIHGAFTTTLKDWVAPIDDSFLYSLFGDSLSTYKGVTWPFFKVNPNTLDDIFAVKVNSTWDTDQLLVNCNIGCYVTRPLSADGVPY